MYGEIYYHEYCIIDTQRPARVSIRKKGYSGSATAVEAGRVPFIKGKLDSDSDLLGGVYPTMATITLIGFEDFGMDNFRTASDSEYQVVHLIEDEVDWIGFLTSEGFSEEDTEGYRELQFNCFDGLTRLKGVPFADTNGLIYGTATGIFDFTLLFAVKECLKKTGLALDIHTLVDRSSITVPTPTAFNVNSLADGWVYSIGFNSLSPSDLAVGNYITYTMEGGAQYTSLIVDNDINIGTPDGSGILLNPRMPEGLNIDIDASFYSAAASTSVDVLAQITHDVRVWVDLDTEVERERKDQEDDPYYDFPNGLVSAWDVLEAIALEFDFRVTQHKGVWIAESLDSHRMTNQFFCYDPEGVYESRKSKDPVLNIPCDYDQTTFRFAGAKRFWDKTLKTVSVAYKYRYRSAEDGLISLQPNGRFELGTVGPPATYTPFGWSRFSLQKPITFNIVRSTHPNIAKGYLVEFSTPNQFNSFNGLKSAEIKIGQGDIFNMSWDQSFEEYIAPPGFVDPHVAMVIELTATNGDVYYLVNYEDQKGWADIQFSSPKPKGQWVRREEGITWHFLSNYATSHISTTSPSGVYTPLSSVELVSQQTPVAGTIVVKFVGVVLKRARTGSTGSDMYKSEFFAWSYIQHSYDPEQGLVTYTPWSPNAAPIMTFYRGEFDVRAKIGDVKISKIVEGSRSGGRFYEYTQNGEYFDKLENITIHLGDEDNPDHLSVLKRLGNVQSVWTNLDGSLGSGPIGLMLTRSVMRRYYKPKLMIDGALSDDPMELNDVFTFEDTPDTELSIKQGKIEVREHKFSGTLVQNPKWVLPTGGVDFGPNSLKDGSSGMSSLGSSSGASEAWVASQGYLRSSDLSLQKTLDSGNIGDKIKITDSLVIPTQAPDPGDLEEGSLFIDDTGVDPLPVGSDLEDLSNVDITTRTDGYVVYWDATAGKYKLKAAGGGGSQDLASVLANGNSTDQHGILLYGAGYGKGYRVRGGAEMFGGASGEKLYFRAADGYYLESFTPASKQMLVVNPDGEVTYEAIPSGGGGGGSTAWADITGKPTTLAGYGITNAMSTSHPANDIAGSDITDWDYAYTVSHTHSNKSALDSISGTDIINWNNAYLDRHTHSNKANLDTINQNLSTTSSVQFSEGVFSTRLRIPTSAPSSPQNGDLYLDDTSVDAQSVSGKFEDLTDVDIAARANGYVPYWDSATESMKFKAPSSGGGAQYSNFVEITGGTDTLNATRANCHIVGTNSSGITITVANASSMMPVRYRQNGAGKITFVADSGITLLVPPGKIARTRGDNSIVELFYETSTRVIIFGDLDS